MLNHISIGNQDFCNTPGRGLFGNAVLRKIREMLLKADFLVP
jgi:hypothetical protein